MNRRNFIKLSAVTGIGVLLPLKFLIDNRDNETRFLEYAINNYNELQVIALIKEYGYVESKGAICSYFKGLVQRQPHIVTWLRERISITKNSDGTKTIDHVGYEAVKNNWKLSCEYNLWASIEHDKLATKFGLKHNDGLEHTIKWLRADLEEIRLRG